MKRMTKMKSVLACVCAVLMIALAVVPMFTLSASAADGAWTLVTDAADLAAGDKVIIAASEYNVALSTNQKSNNRGQTTITKNGDVATWSVTDVQEITLEAGTQSGTFAFNVGTKGYLYAASSKSNYLKSSTTKNDDASWKITINSDGVASIIAQGSNTRNCMQYNQSSSLFACYASASQKGICLYKWVEATASECTHPSTKNVVSQPTCDIDGFTKVVCNDCGETIETSTISALGHDLDDGVVTTKPSCEAAGEKTYTCQRDGCDYEETELVPILEHTFVGGVCTSCGASESDQPIVLGTYYIAALRDNYYYMVADLGTASTTRYQAQTAGATLPEEIVEPDSDLVFEIVELDGKKYIRTLSGQYLGHTASKNNGTFEDDITKAVAITFDNNNGVYNIHYTASDAERYLALNGTSGNNYFAWYKSGQKQNLTLIPVVTDDGEEEVLPEILGANLNIGNDLTMKYHVVLPEGADVSKYSMQFTLNEKTVTVTACVAGEGEYVFAFEGIAPQLMGDTIVAKLLCDGAEVDTYNYSVKEYAVDTMALHSEYKTLLSDLLAYGAAAQTYRNYKTDALVNVDVDGYEPSATAPVLADKVTTLTESTSEVASFTAAGVYFDYTNKIYVKLTATTLEGVVVKVNGTAVDVEAYGNGYIAYSEAVSALDFGKTFTVTLEVGGEVVQTLTYSINSYVYTKCANAGAEPTAMQALALALYRYGASALAANA